MKKYIGLTVTLVLLPSILLFADEARWIEIALTSLQARSSSVLMEKNKPASYYGAHKAADNDLKTAWCTNKHGSTVTGEWIELDLAPQAGTGIQFLPGIGNSQGLYMSNNIITKAKVSVYTKDGSKLEKVITDDELTLCTDERNFYGSNGYQEPSVNDKTPCGLDGYRSFGMVFAFAKTECINRIRIEILEVKRGKKWDDTCIAEIKTYHPMFFSSDSEAEYENNVTDMGCR